MKTLLFLICISFTLTAQNNDWQKMKMKGKPKTIKEIADLGTTDYIFNTKGYLFSKSVTVSLFGQKIIKKELYGYNEIDSLISIKTFANNKPAGKTEFVYLNGKKSIKNFDQNNVEILENLESSSQIDTLNQASNEILKYDFNSNGDISAEYTIDEKSEEFIKNLPYKNVIAITKYLYKYDIQKNYTQLEMKSYDSSQIEPLMSYKCKRIITYF